MPYSIVTYKDFNGYMRFDAEFYHPEKLLSEKILGKFMSNIDNNFQAIRKIEIPKNENGVLSIDLEDIFADRINNIKSLKGWEVGSAKKIIQKNDVIISRLMSYLKQIAINYNHEKLYGSTEFIVLRKKSNSKINKEVLFVFLLSEVVQKILNWSQEGSNHPRFSQSLLTRIRVPVPSKPVQDKIEKNLTESNELFFSSINKYNAAIKIIEQELGINALKLKGKTVTLLTYNEFISELRFDAQYFSSLKLKSIFESEFETKPLNQLCDNISTGLTPAKESYWHKGYPVLKMGCLTNSGIDWSKIEFANETYFKKAKKFLVNENDIFLTSSAHALEHIAKKVDMVSGIPKEYKNKLVFVGEVLRLKVKKELINPYFLLLFLRTKIGYKLLQNCIRGQTAHIYPKDIKNIEIPLISEKKQNEIEKLLKESEDLRNQSADIIKKSIKEIENLIEEN